MRYTELGTTHLPVSVVSFGTTCMLTGGRDNAVRAVHRAIDLGINLFDTAPSYSDGIEEEVLGGALADYRYDLMISTKVGYLKDRAAHRNQQSLMRQLEASLRRLQTTYVDILYVHEADFAWWWRDADDEVDYQWPFPILEEETAVDVACAPVIAFLEKARIRGMFRYLGVSGKNARILARIVAELPASTVMVAHQLNAIYRNAVAFLLEPCRARQVGIVVGSPLMRGWLAQPQRGWEIVQPTWMDDVFLGAYTELLEIQGASHLTLTELSLRWLVSEPRVDSICIGFGSADEVTDDIAMIERGPLTEVLKKSIDRLGIVHPLIFQGRAKI